MISVPSSPRLMRPLFSVSVSPRLTNRNGVVTRNAPPITAIGTPHMPMLAEASAKSRLLSLEDLVAPVRRFGRQNGQEDDPLEDRDAGVGEVLAALNHAAACLHAPEQQRHRNDRQ